MEQVYDNEVYSYTPSSPAANALANNKNTATLRFLIVVIILLVICLIISVTSLVGSFVPVNGSQKSLDERLAKVELTIESDKAELMRLEGDNAELRIALNQSRQDLNTSLKFQQELTESLQGQMYEVTSELRVALNETRQDLQANTNNQQLLSESLRSLSDEVTSYHLVEAEISCSSGYKRNPYANTCIRLVSISRNWYSAKSGCESSGERLATFETLESQYWFINLRMTSWKAAYNVWVGGSRSSGVWRWDGQAPNTATIIIWGPEEPNNEGGEDCIESSIAECGKFNDKSCSESRVYVCEQQT